MGNDQSAPKSSPTKPKKTRSPKGGKTLPPEGGGITLTRAAKARKAARDKEIFQAVERGNMKAVETALKFRKDIIKDYAGKESLLTIAMRTKNWSFMTFLIQNGADPCRKMYCKMYERVQRILLWNCDISRSSIHD